MKRTRIIGVLLILVITCPAHADMNSDFLDAVKKGDNDTVEALTENDIDLNVKDKKYGRTALIWAVIKGHKETVKILIAKGADTTVKDKNSKSALEWAQLYRNYDIVDLVKNAGTKGFRRISAKITKENKTNNKTETLEAQGQRLYQEGKQLQQKGEYKKALNSFEQALVIIKKVYGNEHPSVVATLTNIGVAWDSLGKYHKAIDYYGQALVLGRKVHGEKHPANATTLNNLAMSWKRLGKYKKAKEYLEEALVICRATLGENHPYTKAAKASLSDIQAKLQQ